MCTSSGSTDVVLGQQKEQEQANLELNHLSLPLLVSSKFEVFAALKGDLLTDLAFRTLHPEHNLLGSLGLYGKSIKLWVIYKTKATFDDNYLLPEDGFGLTTITSLFSVVTATTLGSSSLLGLLVLRNFMSLVGLAFLAIRTTGLRYVHLEDEKSQAECNKLS